MDAETTAPPKAQEWLLRVIRVAEILAKTQDETDEEAVESTDTHPVQQQKTQN